MPRALLTIIIVPLSLASAGCPGDTGPRTIDHTRTATVPPRPVKLDATDAERFRQGPRPQAPGRQPDLGGKPQDGWQPAQVPMAVEAFTVGSTQITLTVLPGVNLEANINRWRGQMQQPPLTPEQVAALPRDLKILDRPALRVEIEGDYQGRGDPAPRPDYALLGAILSLPRAGIFVKMIGPAAEVAAERERFVAYCASVGQRDLPPSPHGGAAHPPTGPSGPPAPQGSPHGNRAGDLLFKLPPGWEHVQNPTGGMRLYTFHVGEQRLECAVFAFRGTAGGVEDNVNRWLAQLAQPPYSTDEVADLPTIEVMGRKGALLEATGTFTDRGQPGQEGYMILGLICPLQGETLVVKMVGPEPAVRAERDRFIDFCSSLSQG